MKTIRRKYVAWLVIGSLLAALIAAIWIGLGYVAHSWAGIFSRASESRVETIALGEGSVVLFGPDTIAHLTAIVRPSASGRSGFDVVDRVFRTTEAASRIVADSGLVAVVEEWAAHEGDRAVLRLESAASVRGRQLAGGLFLVYPEKYLGIYYVRDRIEGLSF
jgi:hypothetical protein